MYYTKKLTSATQHLYIFCSWHGELIGIATHSSARRDFMIWLYCQSTSTYAFLRVRWMCSFCYLLIFQESIDLDEIYLTNVLEFKRDIANELVLLNLRHIGMIPDRVKLQSLWCRANCILFDEIYHRLV